MKAQADMADRIAFLEQRMRDLRPVSEQEESGGGMISSHLGSSDLGSAPATSVGALEVEIGALRRQLAELHAHVSATTEQLPQYEESI